MSFSTEKTFKTQRIVAYYSFGIISIACLLTLISFLLKNDFINLVPDFLEPLLTKHDWLGVIYFPSIIVLLSIPIFIFSCKYKWFCRKTSYYINNDTITFIDNKRNIGIQIKDIKQVNCKMKAALFPISSKRATKEQICKYYKLSIKTSDNKYSFYSLPFRQEEQDFRNFMEDLRTIGLKFEIKVPLVFRSNIK